MKGFSKIALGAIGVLTITLFVLAVGCGDDEEENGDETTPTATPAATTPSETDDATPTPPEELNEETLRIGFIDAMTGPAAAFGTFGLNGFEVAVDDVNEEGIVIGDTRYKFEIAATIDTESDPANEAAGITQLAEDEEVYAIVGPLIGTGNDMSHLTFPNKIFFMSSQSAGGLGGEKSAAEQTECITSGNCKYTFQAITSTKVTVPGYVQHALDFPELEGAERIAVLQPDLATGRSNLSFLETLIPAMGLELVYGDVVDIFNTTDYSPVLTEIKATDPDVLIYTGFAESITSLMTKTAVDLDVASIGYVAFGGALTDALTFGPDEGPIDKPFVSSIPPRSLFEDDPFVNDYRAKLSAKAGVPEEELEFNTVASLGLLPYGQVACLASAMEQAQSIDPDVVVETMTSEDFECDPPEVLLRWGDLLHDSDSIGTSCVVDEGETRCENIRFEAVSEEGEPVENDPNRQFYTPLS